MVTTCSVYIFCIYVNDNIMCLLFMKFRIKIMLDDKAGLFNQAYLDKSQDDVFRQSHIFCRNINRYCRNILKNII